MVGEKSSGVVVEELIGGAKLVNEKIKKIIAQYEAVRRLGQTNMFDRIMVQRIAHENHFYELVIAIEDGYGKILENYSEWMKLVNEDDIPKAKQIVPNWGLEQDTDEEEGA